jgi:hypothetical protein
VRKERLAEGERVIKGASYSSSLMHTHTGPRDEKNGTLNSFCKSILQTRLILLRDNFTFVQASQINY